MDSLSPLPFLFPPLPCFQLPLTASHLHHFYPLPLVFLKGYLWQPIARPPAALDTLAVFAARDRLVVLGWRVEWDVYSEAIDAIVLREGGGC